MFLPPCMRVQVFCRNTRRASKRPAVPRERVESTLRAELVTLITTRSHLVGPTTDQTRSSTQRSAARTPSPPHSAGQDRCHARAVSKAIERSVCGGPSTRVPGRSRRAARGPRQRSAARHHRLRVDSACAGGSRLVCRTGDPLWRGVGRPCPTRLPSGHRCATTRARAGSTTSVASGAQSTAVPPFRDSRDARPPAGRSPLAIDAPSRAPEQRRQQAGLGMHARATSAGPARRTGRRGGLRAAWALRPRAVRCFARLVDARHFCAPRVCLALGGVGSCWLARSAVSSKRTSSARPPRRRAPGSLGRPVRCVPRADHAMFGFNTPPHLSRAHVYD